jgi:UDP-3-O-acyl-N-acetylglucosamine deacetylase
VDLIGDLALLGARIEADIVAFKPNHKGNVALARFIERTANMDVLL